MKHGEPELIKVPLPYGYVVYQASDTETERKVDLQLQNPPVKPQLVLRSEVR